MRGFIGPIGDDIPSLFPIIAGVMIFLLSVYFIQVQIEQRNAYVEVRRGTLELSYIVTEKGHMSDFDFSRVCSKVKEVAAKKSMNVTLFLKNYCRLDSRKQIDLMDNLELAPDSGDLLCSDWEDAILDSNNKIDLGGRDAVFMTYPIAVDCMEANRGLGLITVIGWRG